jgi:Raf kinase inhibitor-like YbhB/YbcL family protein
MIHSILEHSIKYLNVQSKAFSENEMIPKKYSCDGINVNPPLEISFIPNETVSLAIIMEDPDAPINIWSHWVAWNIPVTHHILEDMHLGKNGLNDFNKHFYCGPCPMAGMHQYVFRVFALDTLLELKANTRKYDLEKAMAGHVLAYGELAGYYGKKMNEDFSIQN